MKVSLLVLLLLFAVPLAFADIGPSPRYSFSISNAADYPGYSFYYAGNIWPHQLTRISGDTSVYKFNTEIIVYAVPKELAKSDEIGKEQPGITVAGESDFNIAAAASVVSQKISLKAGNTVFEIKSFDATNKTMLLEAISQSPDLNYPVQQFFWIGLPLIIIVVIALAIIAAVFFCSKKLCCCKKPDKK